MLARPAPPRPLGHGWRRRAWGWIVGAHPWVRPRPLSFGWLLAFALTACLPPQASFSPGVGTGEVKGVVELPPPDPAAGPPLIVVFKHHHKFTGFDNERAITHPSAHVATVGEFGQFSITMPADVVEMDVFFAAPERLTDVFHFRRQLGIGVVTYRARLPVIRDWRSHFYTYIEPEFEHLIVDSRYNLSPRDQEVLTRWLTDQKGRLEARPAAGNNPQPPR
jgi:hypothetical protein